MVTKPIPIWERWMHSPDKREKLYTLFYVALMLVNAFIVIGVILFMLFWINR